MLISEFCGSLNVQRSGYMPKYVQFVPLKLIEANWAEEFPGATALLASDPVSVAAGGIFGCDEVFNRIRMVCEVHWNISIYQNIHGFSMTWPANAEFWWILMNSCMSMLVYWRVSARFCTFRWVGAFFATFHPPVEFWSSLQAFENVLLHNHLTMSTQH